MPGLGIRIPRLGPGTGPRLPVSLYTLGTPGVKHRYVADRITQGAGEIVQHWADSGPGSRHLMHLTAENFVVEHASGHKVVSKIPGGGSLVAAGATPAGTPGTIAVAMIVDEGNTLGQATKTVIRGFGLEFGQSGNNSWEVKAGTSRANIATPGHTWGTLVFTFDGVSPITPGEFLFNVNGTEKSTLDAGTEMTPGSSEDLTLNLASSIPFKIAEIAIFDRELTSGQIATVRAAMQAQYGFLS